MKCLSQISFLLFISFKVYSQDCDACNKLIANGFYNKLNIQNQGSLASNVKNWLLSDNFREYMRSKNGSLNISIPTKGFIPISGGGNFDYGSYEQVKEYLDKGDASSLNQSFAISVAQQVVDQGVINAWSKCVAENCSLNTGLQSKIEGDPNVDDIFNLVLFYKAGFSTMKATINFINVKGGEYDSSYLRIGRSITTEPIRVPIVRIGNQKIHIVINTENGSISQSIEKKLNRNSADQIYKSV